MLSEPPNFEQEGLGNHKPSKASLEKAEAWSESLVDLAFDLDKTGAEKADFLDRLRDLLESGKELPGNLKEAYGRILSMIVQTVNEPIPIVAQFQAMAFWALVNEKYEIIVTDLTNHVANTHLQEFHSDASSRLDRAHEISQRGDLSLSEKVKELEELSDRQALTNSFNVHTIEKLVSSTFSVFRDAVILAAKEISEDKKISDHIRRLDIPTLAELASKTLGTMEKNWDGIVMDYFTQDLGELDHYVHQLLDIREELENDPQQEDLAA